MIKLRDFWEDSMTVVRRDKTQEQINSDFLLEHENAYVTGFFPNISTCEIMVLLDIDEEEGEEDYE